MTTITTKPKDRHKKCQIIPNGMAISVIVPVYNEEDSITLLCKKLFISLNNIELPFEVVFVNDGSGDKSLEILKNEAVKYPQIKIINLRRNYGQTAAIMAGIDHSSGNIIVTIDADLQNDPEDIPALLSKLNEGFDVVSGWRRNRRDAPVRRNFLSAVANVLISRISGVKLNDYGCTLKAYRRDVLSGVRLYGEMHRFIPIYASWMGARIVEIPVRHHQRKFGRSKYGLERIVKVILDLIVVKFLDRNFVKPIYVFGGFGIISIATSIVTFVYMVWLKVMDGVSMILTPLPLVSAMTLLVGIVSILMGLLAEMLVRTYFESQDRRTYFVKDFINFVDTR